ncbi:hypothetical protein L9F63_010326, partial [Diploptera punctata]
RHRIKIKCDRMNRNLQSPSQLTEFAPLSPEPSQPGVGFLLSKFFRFSTKDPGESALPVHHDNFRNYPEIYP